MPVWSIPVAAVRQGLVLLGLGIAGHAEELIFNTQDFAPFTYLRDRAAAGPAVAVIQAVCKEMDQPCRINLLPWARAQLDVKAGKAHALFLIGWNAERATWLHPSLPILATEYGFFVHENNPLVFKDVSQLERYWVAVYGPSNTSATLERIKSMVPGMTIDMTPDDGVAFKKLDAGRVQAVFSNRDAGTANLLQLGLKRVRYAGIHSTLNYFVGFSKSGVPMATVEKFNQAYRKLHRAGEIKKLLKAYGLEPAPLD